MDSSYGERYRELYEKHWWWRAREAAVLDLLRRHCPARGWKTVLDIGCGDGLFFDRLAEFGDVEGVEPMAELLNPSGPHRDRIHVQPFESFQPDKQYSLILMLDVLEHVPNAVEALRHALDLLAPEGTFLATVPAFRSLWTNHDILNHHVTRYTKASLRQIARQAGLQISMERYWFQWTCPVKLVSGVMERILRVKPVPARVPPVWVNTALYCLSRVEQRLLGSLPVPFGSSLVVIAHKAAAVAGDTPVDENFARKRSAGA